ncbi:extracellular solute-binding protein [Clostridium sp. MCC353]|uniref:ABC transporter substrate-binding protein n=1 Tax=Clostridium sp. MCC353 TaxID=2592646 RepID=UPI001C014C32|nr:sugar ABC transporter substrate-binding protein [Clostridium sp. MCC353]MBT9778989.1 extracellular solute-binding protein [Clostridium sp. MCC353]
MKKSLRKLAALGISAVMGLSLAGCGSGSSGGTTAAGSDPAASSVESSAAGTQAAGTENEGGPVTIKITWWGGQGRHDYTQKMLDAYTASHPNVTFEAMPSGWDGYFDKLATQAASGSMPDIVQMDYLYITTYAKNNSLADLQQFVDDGTIDTSKIDENLLNTGEINGKLNGLVLSSSYISVGYNPEVLAEAGVEEPTGSWTWDDFIRTAETVKEKTGKYGMAGGPVDDTNLFNYWIRQHGESLFSEDKKAVGYADDKLCADFIKIWADLMAKGAAPNPDEYAAIQTLGEEGRPVVTGDGAMLTEWNNYATKVSGANDKLKMVTPPMAAGSDTKGLWMKPGMFFSIADTSKVKKEAAEFINWFVNSEEANDIMMAERGTPVSSDIRDYMVSSGKLSDQQSAMFKGVEDALAFCGETPDPDPVGMSEVNESFKNAAYSAFYGQVSPEEAAAKFRKDADAILSRNN